MLDCRLRSQEAWLTSAPCPPKHAGQTVLCVCCTNHALDQFLEALLDKGITGIVRVGFQSKSERLEPYTMKSLLSADGAKRLDTNEWRRLNDLRDQLPIQKEKVGLLNQSTIIRVAQPRGSPPVCC
jgi:hypothetical protein